MRFGSRRRNRSRQSAPCTNSACGQAGVGTSRRFGRHGGQVRFGSTGGCRIWWAWRGQLPPRRSPANAPSDRRHGVLPARSRFSGRRSVRAGSWCRCCRGHVGALGLRRCIQVGTDLPPSSRVGAWRQASGSVKSRCQCLTERKPFQSQRFPLGAGIRSYHAAAELAHAAERPQWSTRASVSAVAGAR